MLKVLLFGSGQISTAVVGVNSENHSNGQVWQLTIHREFTVFPWCSINLHPQIWRLLSLSDEGLGSALVSPIAKEGRKKNQTQHENPEVMLCRILRTYWIWLYGGKKQQSWSKKPVNDCHCLCGCDSYWSSNSSKNGNISQVVINIVSARKPIVLFCAGSCQVELQRDTGGLPLESHPTSACTTQDRFTHVKNLRLEVQVYSSYIWTCEAFDPFPLDFSVHKSII